MSTNKIKGGVKFFDINYALFKFGTTASASSNDEGINSILDVSRYTQWESVGSNDLTTETITINFPRGLDIDRLFLVDMNFKEFNVKYYDGLSFVDFTNIVGVNGVEYATITETIFAEDTAYYEFDSVNTTSIQIQVTKTQSANAQKALTQFIATQEIGTMEGFPRLRPDSNRNETKAKALSRRYVVQKTYETNRIKLTFKTHPFQNDVDICENLFNREEPFLVWPCGGRTGEQFFKISMMNWRLKDIYNMQLTGRMKNEFERGVYLLGFNKSLTFEEHV